MGWPGGRYGSNITSSFAGAVDGRANDLRRGRFEGPETPIQGIVTEFGAVVDATPFKLDDGADELRSTGMSELRPWKQYKG
jgi:hypothetical protein